MLEKAEKRVLLVEDDLDARDVLQDLLEDEGFDVVPAANGKQAIDYLTLDNDDGADIVILDLMMPMISGWEVLERMTDDHRLADIPVIVLSAVTTAKPSRAQGFLHKPFSLDTLVDTIRTHLSDGPTDAQTNN
jgi:two-component system response regulator CpxR